MSSYQFYPTQKITESGTDDPATASQPWQDTAPRNKTMMIVSISVVFNTHIHHLPLHILRSPTYSIAFQVAHDQPYPLLTKHLAEPYVL
jgi:hypothetical protein